MTVNWEQIAASWRELCADTAHDPPAHAFAVSHHAERLSGSDDAYCGVVHRDAVDMADPVQGWRIVAMWHKDESPGRLDDVDAALADLSYVGDPHVQGVMANAGTTRALLRYDATTPEQWHGSAMRTLLESLGVVDQLVMAVPVAHDVELFIGVSRMHGEPYSQDDKARMQAWLSGLQASAMRLAASVGPPRQRLTVRERQVLGFLLSSGSETEIACALGVATKTIHNHVTRVYRKLGVSSRAELMAWWLALADG